MMPKNESKRVRCIEVIEVTRYWGVGTVMSRSAVKASILYVRHEVDVIVASFCKERKAKNGVDDFLLPLIQNEY